MSSGSAEAVANIEELLTQIFVSLPLPSLARFKCVSKHWRSLISNLHILKTPKISAFFSSKIQDESFQSISFGNHEMQPGWNPFKTLNKSVPDGSELKIVQSCNGLFLCHNISRFEAQTKYHLVYVVNPTTNQFRVVPSPRKRKEMERYDFVRYALAFDPSKSPHYKVVCVINSVGSNSNIWEPKQKPGHHKIHIYSSETGKWKHQNIRFFQSLSDRNRHHNKNMPMHFDERSSESAVFCNGAVHWVRASRDVLRLPIRYSEARRGEFGRKTSDVLHYFDIGQERFLLVSSTPPVPLVVKNIPMKDSSDCPTLWPELAQRYFGESGGNLYLIETYEHCKTQVDVMEMKMDYSGWLIKYHIDLNPVLASLTDSNAFVILCISQEKEKDNNGHEVDSSADLLLLTPDKVISYDMRDETFKISVEELANEVSFLALGDEYLSYRSRPVMHPYMKSLACLRR